MLIFSAKPLQFNKKWLEHSKQFLIVLFKVTNSLVYGYIVSDCSTTSCAFDLSVRCTPL